MNIYIQVLSQVQTVEVAQLLLLPAALGSVQSGCRLKISGGGKVRTRSFETVDKAVADIQSAKFNELEIAYRIAGDGGFRMTGHPVSAVGLLTISPTCALWFRSEEWPVGGDRAMRSRRLNAKAKETGLDYYKVSQAPSILEFVLETETTESQSRVLDSCAEWLAAFVPECLGSLGIFGCVDVGGCDFFVKLESSVLMTEHIRIMARLWPSAYPELGRRFDGLHPVMFGSKKLCQGIGSALDKDARVLVSDAMSDFAVVRLTVGCESEAARRRASPWLLPRAEELPVSSGESENC